MHLNVKLWLRVKGLGIGCVLTRSPFNLTMQWSISTLTCFCCVQVSITSCHRSVDSLQCLLCRALAFVKWILAQTKMCGFGISLGKCLPLHSVVKQTRDCEHTSFSGHFGVFFFRPPPSVRSPSCSLTVELISCFLPINEKARCNPLDKYRAVCYNQLKAICMSVLRPAACDFLSCHLS